MRYVATYELVDRDGKSLGAMAELPVVSLPEPSADGKLVPATVIEPERGAVVPFGTGIEHPSGVLEPLFLTAVPEPIAAEPGWVAEVWTMGFSNEPAEEVGTFDVLSWEEAMPLSPELPTEGSAIVLVREPGEWTSSGPMSTRLLPGLARYRRRDEPAFGPPTPLREE